MAINYEDLLARQEEARAEFGRVLREWRRRNGWKVWDPARIAEYRGFSPVAYGLWGDLEQGIFGEISPKIFGSLGSLNKQPGIIAVANCDGSLWGPMDFFALYCGLHTAPWRWREP